MANSLAMSTITLLIGIILTVLAASDVRAQADSQTPALLPSITVPPAPQPPPPQPPGVQPDASEREGRVELKALLSSSGPVVKSGLVWRVYKPGPSGSPPVLVSTHHAPRPTVELAPGSYLINVAFGLAHLTRQITIAPDDTKREDFVINAGGLRIQASTERGSFSSPAVVTYDLFSDERDQFGKRQKIIGNVRPGGITRLNSGIYHIVSKLGDVNALVSAEVTVEAGKLTEATVVHEVAKVTFKLVQSPGGDALADAQWIIMTEAGKVIKETAGALPSHILAPGNYTISARWGGKLHTRTFAIKSGDNVEVEVVIQ